MNKKSDGKFITIKFTKPLINETFNQDAFKVKGKEKKYIGGELVDKEYEVKRVDYRRYQTSNYVKWNEGTLEDVQVSNGGDLTLKEKEGDE